MADNNMNVNEVEEIEEPMIITLTDSESGEDMDFEVLADSMIGDNRYFALIPAGDEESEEYVILRVTEDGDDLVLETIEDDEEFEKVEDFFNDLFFGEVDYDE